MVNSRPLPEAPMADLLEAPPVGLSSTRLLDRYEGLKDRLPGAREARVRAWRERGASAFRAQGFPSRRVEAWKYTDLSLLRETRFGEALIATDSHPPLPDRVETPAIVLVDGRFRADLSALERLPRGVSILPLGEALSAGADSAIALLGSVSPDGQPLPGLNAALAEDGAVILVADGVDGGTIRLLSLAAARPGHPIAFHPRHLVHLGAGARLTLLEDALGDEGTLYWHNPVMEIALSPRARLVHIRRQQEGLSAAHTGMVAVRVEAGAEYDSFTLACGARLARNEVHAVLAGAGAALHLNGAQLVDGVRHADTTTVIEHAAPHCASRQTVKTVLTGRARGVFQGKIHVHRVAQKTDGYQMNQALLLSREAEIDAKPQLEIYADDVKCSHGATVGELDREALFYLRSRGLAEAEAKSILVQAFLDDAVGLVADEALRAALHGTTERWWRRVEQAA